MDCYAESITTHTYAPINRSDMNVNWYAIRSLLGGDCLAPRKSLKFRLKSPITDPEEILSVEIFITVFAEKRTFIKDWIVFA